MALSRGIRRYSRGIDGGLDAPIRPAQPALVHSPPIGPAWIHEIKHDGYRIIAVRQGDAVRLWSRAGKEWSANFPGIRDALLALPAAEVVIDGEAVAHGSEGHQDFHGLRSRAGRKHAILFAFDLLILNGEDMRRWPLLARKAMLERLLAGAGDRIRFVEHLEAEGPVVFKHACALGLEGIVSKRVDAPYTHGPTRNWLKTKNPAYGRRSFRR